MKNITDLTLSDFGKAFIPLKRRGALETAQRICAMCIEILSYAARFRYHLEDKNLIFDLQQYKKEDLTRPIKGKLATITEPGEIGEYCTRLKNRRGGRPTLSPWRFSSRPTSCCALVNWSAACGKKSIWKRSNGTSRPSA